MAEIQFQDQTVNAISRLITQWQDKPNVVGLLKSYIDNVQVVEDIYEQLNTERGIETAIGVQLDVLGLIVGVLREGRTDDDYRIAIKGQIAINTCDGTEMKITEALTILLGTSDITIKDNYPAGITVEVLGLELDQYDSTLQILGKIVAATILPTLIAGFDLIFDTGDTLGISQNAVDNLSVVIAQEFS